MTAEVSSIQNANVKNPKPSLRVCSFTGSFLACLFAIGTGSVSAQSLTWDPNGNTAPNPSDGAGNWLDANVWWDGAANVGWNNVTNASTTAIFGNTAVATGTGQAGAITLTGGVSAGGLQIGSVDLSTDLLTGYSFSGGTLTLANNGRIELFAGSTDSNPIAQRLRFMATSVLAGSNITIANNVTGNTGFGLVTLSGSNTWTGTLGLTGNSGGLFIEATTINALSSLGAINVNANASLVLNYASGILNVPITMGGSGAGQRGALRFDQSRTVSSNITLSAATRIATNGSTVTGTLSGNISGSSGLVMDHTGTTAIGGIVFTGNNTYTTLSVVKGNAQIGVAGVGTSGTGTVTLNGATAVLSGTGTAKGAVTVTNGMIRPGDNLGDSMGTLNITGNLTFNPAAASTVAQFTIGSPLAVSDRINVTTGGVALGATSNLVVAFQTGYTATLGDSWHLIDSAGAIALNGFSGGTNLRTGADADGNEGNLNLPDVSGTGLGWDVATGTNSLVVTLVAIPEPASALLAGLGLAAASLRRRRA